MPIKFSVAALTFLAGIAFYIPMSANSSTSTVALPTRVRPSVIISQATQRANYKQIPLGNISSPLTGNDPKRVALRAFPSPEPPATQQVTLNKPTANKAVAIITQMDLEDDSVRGIRYWVELDRTGQQWKIVWVGYQVRCRQGRGHQNWSPVNCI